jgi:hypothetical protein
VDEAALEKALGDGRLRVRFDRDCRLRSASLDLGFVRPAGEGSPVSVDVDLDASVTFDGYGGVAAGEAAVPALVRESAVDAKDPLDVEGLTRELEGARRWVAGAGVSGRTAMHETPFVRCHGAIHT